MKPIYNIILLLFSVLFFSSCEENESLENNEKTIAQSSFEQFKKDSFIKLNSLDIDMVLRPYEYDIDFNLFLNKSHDLSNLNSISDYKRLYRDKEILKYLDQLETLQSWILSLRESDFFEENVTLEEKVPYIELVIDYSLNQILSQYKFFNSNNNCQQELNICINHAEEDLSDNIVICTVSATFFGILTAGPGAASWPFCMGAAGMMYENAVSACHDYYDACMANQ